MSQKEKAPKSANQFHALLFKSPYAGDHVRLPPGLGTFLRLLAYSWVGACVGTRVGGMVGMCVAAGLGVGAWLGRVVGLRVGTRVGGSVGKRDGW